MEVDSVEEWPRDSRFVTRDRAPVTAAISSDGSPPTARAGVRRRNEQKMRGEDASRPRPGEHDLSLLEYLTEGLEAAAIEFGQLVEEQHAPMSE